MSVPIGWQASAYVIAAMCGCWYWESGLNPGVWEGLEDLRETMGEAAWSYVYQYEGVGGFGLGQWTNTYNQYTEQYSMRLLNLHQYVTNPEHNYGDGDGEGQLRFVIHENAWLNSSQSRLGYTSLYEFINSDSTNLEDLVWDFLANWEGVAGDHYQERVENAQEFLECIITHIADDPSTFHWFSYNGYPTEESKVNNLMMIWNWWGNGERPFIRMKRHRLPIWMYI